MLKETMLEIVEGFYMNTGTGKLLVDKNKLTLLDSLVDSDVAKYINSTSNKKLLELDFRVVGMVQLVNKATSSIYGLRRDVVFCNTGSKQSFEDTFIGYLFILGNTIFYLTNYNLQQSIDYNEAKNGEALFNILLTNGFRLEDLYTLLFNIRDINRNFNFTRFNDTIYVYGRKCVYEINNNKITTHFAVYDVIYSYSYKRLGYIMKSDMSVLCNNSKFAIFKHYKTNKIVIHRIDKVTCKVLEVGEIESEIVQDGNVYNFCWLDITYNVACARYINYASGNSKDKKLDVMLDCFT